MRFVTLAAAIFGFTSAADQEAVEKEDFVAIHGGFSAPMYDKYEAVVSKKEFGPRVDQYDWLHAQVFGPTPEQERLSKSVDALTRRTYKSKFGKRLRAEAEVGLDSNGYGIFTASMYPGKRQRVDMQLDSATDWTVVSSSKYDIRSNVNSGQASVLKEDVTRVYGFADLYGDVVQDTFCVTITRCANSLQYFYETGQKAFASDDGPRGSVGLARNEIVQLTGVDAQDSTADNFLISKLRRDNTIKAEAFGLNMDTSSVPYVEFGTPQFPNSGEVTSLSVNQDFFWSNWMAAIRFGPMNANAYVFGPSENAVAQAGALYTVWDTSSPTIKLSVLYFERAVLAYFDLIQQTFENRNGKIFFDCSKSSSYPDWYFLMDGSWIQVRSSDLIKDESQARDRTTCQLLVEGVTFPFNIMGSPVFPGYYTSFNYEKPAIELQVLTVLDDRVDNKETIKSGDTTLIENTFAVVLEAENLENAYLISWLIAGACGLLLITAWVLIVIYSLWPLWSTNDNGVLYVSASSVGVLILSAALTWLVQIFILPILEPGNIEMTTDSQADAVKHVRASHLTFLGLVAYAVYKLLPERKAAAKADAKAAPEADRLDALLEEIANQVE